MVAESYMLCMQGNSTRASGCNRARSVPLSSLTVLLDRLDARPHGRQSGMRYTCPQWQLHAQIGEQGRAIVLQPGSSRNFSTSLILSSVAHWALTLYLRASRDRSMWVTLCTKRSFSRQGSYNVIKCSGNEKFSQIRATEY